MTLPQVETLFAGINRLGEPEKKESTLEDFLGAFGGKPLHMEGKQ
jgi:hypothetical protein